MPKVLIAEDDLLIADMAEEMLVEHGYEVCGIARTTAEALALVRRHKPDLAVIDVRLADGELGTAITAQSDVVGKLGVLYATGNPAHVVLTAADGQACLTKPYTSGDLVRSLQIVVEIVTTGSSSPPFPRGFTVLPSAIGKQRDPTDG